MLSFTLNLEAFEENVAVRYKYKQDLESKVLSKEIPKTVIDGYRDGNQVKVQVSSQRKGEFIYYYFINEVYNRFLPYNRGSYSIRKNQNGEIDKIQIFLLNRYDSYVELIASKGQTLSKVKILGKWLYTNIYLPKKLEYFCLSSLEELRRLLSPFVEDFLLFPEYQEPYNTVISMREEILRNINGFPEVFDGAMNERGEFVHIKDGTPQEFPFGFNCSGFAKWIADGLYEAKTGKMIPLERLKRKLLSIRGDSKTFIYEQQRDPFFGLDWVRNLVTVLRLGDSQKEVSDINSQKNDVRELPFIKYIDNRGFSIDDLELSLYLLAIYQPGYFYFGSLSSFSDSSPMLVRHHHVTVLFPWIDEEGSFRVSIMEINDEVSLFNLKVRYPNSYIHLSAVPASFLFKLKPIPIRQKSLGLPSEKEV